MSSIYKTSTKLTDNVAPLTVSEDLDLLQTGTGFLCAGGNLIIHRSDSEQITIDELTRCPLALEPENSFVGLSHFC